MLSLFFVVDYRTIYNRAPYIPIYKATQRTYVDSLDRCGKIIITFDISALIYRNDAKPTHTIQSSYKKAHGASAPSISQPGHNYLHLAQMYITWALIAHPLYSSLCRHDHFTPKLTHFETPHRQTLTLSLCLSSEADFRGALSPKTSIYTYTYMCMYNIVVYI